MPEVRVSVNKTATRLIFESETTILSVPSKYIAVMANDTEIAIASNGYEYTYALGGIINPDTDLNFDNNDQAYEYIMSLIP